MDEFVATGSMDQNLTLNDLLHFSTDQLPRVKIKFNHFSGADGSSALDAYRADPQGTDAWLFWRSNRRNFEIGDTAVNFLRLTEDSWLLTTIKQVTAELGVTGGTNYEGVELKQFGSLYGRLVLKYRSTGRLAGQVRRAEPIIADIEIAQLLPDIYDGDDFPGYDKVRRTYRQLKTLLDRNKRDWVVALGAQKAVYLITDLSNGKHYVGSATARDGMLLDRWKDYVKDGHGGNVELQELVVANGLGYVREHFQYSILENYNQRVGDDFIWQREKWWKATLASRRPFGYNAN